MLIRMTVNLGKWILRFLFDKLIQEEVKRDAMIRENLVRNSSKPNSLRRGNAPTSIQLPNIQSRSSADFMNEDDSVITPRPIANGSSKPATTPGLTIGTATPHLNSTNLGNKADRPATVEEGAILERKDSQPGQSRTSADRKSDYFTSSAQAKSPTDSQSKGAVTPGESSLDETTLASTQLPVNGDKEEKLKESGTLFGKSFRMKLPKKLGGASTDLKPAALDEKSEDSDRSEEKEDRAIQDNFFGTVQRIRYAYEERLHDEPSQHLSSGINPSPFSEAPKLQLPPYTLVIIQDERPDSGGVADLYRGTISSVGYDAELIEEMAPMWLGDLLLKVSSNSF